VVDDACEGIITDTVTFLQSFSFVRTADGAYDFTKDVDLPNGSLEQRGIIVPR
jgi:hypothetical protein